MRDSGKQLGPRTDRQPDSLQHALGEMGEGIEVDLVVLEGSRVLAETESSQPCRNVTHSAASNPITDAVLGILEFRFASPRIPGEGGQDRMHSQIPMQSVNWIATRLG